MSGHIMASPQPIMEMRSLVLAKLESTYNVDAAPSQTADAFFVDNDFDIKVQPQELTRNVLRPTFSPLPSAAGRKLVTVTFTHELKGNLTTSTASKIGTLLRACGMQQIQVAAGASTQIGTPINQVGGTTVTWAKTAAPTSTNYYGRYRITVVKGGASATAQVRVSQIGPGQEDDTVLPSEAVSATVTNPAATPTTTATVNATDPTAVTITIGGTVQTGDVIGLNVFGEPYYYVVQSTDSTAAGVASNIAAALTTAHTLSASAASAVITLATLNAAAPITVTTASTAITLGASGATITPTFSGSLVLGDTWIVQVWPVGFRYVPRSTGFESLTIYGYFDGLLHKVTGCLGSFTVTGKAGEYAKVAFTFQGQYLTPYTATLPSNPVYEDSVPEQMQLARLTMDGITDFAAEQFTFDIANQVQVRPSMNSADGYDGFRITGRKPVGTVSPEMNIPGEYAFFDKLATAHQLPFYVRTTSGDTVGNTVHFAAPAAQYTGLAYNTRNGIRALNANVKFASWSDAGEDEMEIFFN